MSIRILYLYAEVMGYTVATIKELTQLGCEVHVVHWDFKKITPYQMPDFKGFYKYPRSDQNLKSIEDLISKISPDITVVSGWQDDLYIKICKKLRLQNKIVVVGLDQQWQGTLKQKIALILGSFRYFKILFSHAWVSGVFQYEYARNIGFKRDEIIYDLYSADLSIFGTVPEGKIWKSPSSCAQRFLYVGRYEPIKGLDILLAAWNVLGMERKDWELHLVGNGSLKESLAATSGIVVKDFMQPYDLVSEIHNASCFVMPSKEEPWGVVLHEMASAGLPIIVSKSVGAANSFVINGYNGYKFRNLDFRDLAKCMKQIIDHSNEELINMGRASIHLSQQITPMTSASNLLSLIK